ncbi:MAG TPA: tetratricopeptide repeat protein [Anaeromyxobacter sp.]|nr:tetratricopeptide repeat protein [Anaeromyxobacter sp.]
MRGRTSTEAIRLYLAALAADPGIAEAHKKLALCYEEKGEPRRAVAEYRRYLSTDPPDADRVRAALEELQ